jgi:pSer/pThr/pTyr-binding forkhead associated (FHA) protein
MAQVHWWLTDGDGVRLRIDAGGVLIGRSPSCELVLLDPKASRSQALVYLDGARPRLVVLGKGRTLHNGERAQREAKLADGDRIELPGMNLAIGCSEDAGRSGSSWVLERPSGGFFGVSNGPFVIGGHERDDLQLEAWPAHALTLHLTQRRMHLAAGAELEVDGAPVTEGALVPLGAGSLISFRDQTLRVVMGQEVWSGSTMASAVETSDELPDWVRLEFLPRGGRLHVYAGGRARSVYLPGQRSELMALLLKPPAPHEVGDTLEDELLIERLWPKQARTRIDLNTLIYRLRKDLVRAGIDATSLVARAPGGGTRVGLSRGARVEVG